MSLCLAGVRSDSLSAILEMMMRAAHLKWVVRTGWAMRGVPSPESVADHSWGVAMTAMALAQEVDTPLDGEKVLTIALIHDLAEVVLSDIPATALRFLPPEAKSAAERKAAGQVLAPLRDRERLLAWWEEYEAASSPEGRLVRDADRLEMLAQALLYEEQLGCRLAEFWEGQVERPFYFAVSRRLFEALLAQRGVSQ